jgi:tyrosyl-tRNA synthetase
VPSVKRILSSSTIVGVTDFLDELEWRGLLNQTSDRAALHAHLQTGGRKAYVGLDPSAPSLTIGNLVTLMLLAHFQRAGHVPVVLAGGGTGMIGDPGGKSIERPLLSVDDVRANVRAQMTIYTRLFGDSPVLNNADWLEQLSFIGVLRDVGKHFSVNEMVKRDSVRNRMEADGISYTEFSYVLLQAYDFAHLYKHHDVTLQMGGSDQWGNIVSGVDLVRRLHGGTSFALTCPLLLKADGTKFGKSESGAIWLTADRTSPYAFHQFWLNASDSDVIRFLKIFTFLDKKEIEGLAADSAANPAAREAQKALADDVTTRLHGADACNRAKAAGRALFTGDVKSLDLQTLNEAFADVPSSTFSRSDLPTIELVDLLVQTGLASSRREARDHLVGNAVSANGEKIGVEWRPEEADLLHGSLLLLKRGKKLWHATRWQ